MKKFLLSCALMLSLILSVTVNAYEICKLDGGNVEVQSEYQSGDKYIVNVLNDSNENAIVTVNIKFKINGKIAVNKATEISLRLQSTKIEVPIPSGATEVEVTSITGTKCK